MWGQHGSKRTISILRFLILGVLGVGLLVPAVPTRSGIAELPYRLVPAMTTSIGAQLTSLSTDGSLIVWEDHRDGQPDVFAFDISDSREFRPARSPEVRRQPAISGSVIVWVSGLEHGNRSIRGIDLAEGIEFDVTDSSGVVARPTISERVIAWQERSDDIWRIQVLDRRNDGTLTLGESDYPSARPSVSDRYVVWQEHDGESWNLRAYELDSGETFEITDDQANDQYPVVSGDLVAFLRYDPDGGSPALVVSSISGGSERVIINDHYIQQPSIDGNIVVWEDWRSGLPDIYAYDLEHDELFAVARSQQATRPIVSDHVIAWVSGSDPGQQRIQGLSIEERLPTDPVEPPAVPDPERLFVPQTQHYVSSGFKSFWQARGGTQLLGYPLSEEFTEVDPETGTELTVQYFERGKLEFHADASEGQQIRMSRLGYLMRPEQEGEPVEPFEDEVHQRYFEQTGHGVSHGFLEFWERHGGVGVFGFPVTGEFVENGRTVQYFERARFEYDPEAEEGSRVQLGLIGREALQERGWIPPPPVDTTQVFE